MSNINDNNDKTQIASLDSSTKKTSSIHKQNLLGKKISDRYLIEELIGQGGMCYIYRARDTFLENSGRSEASVAIKVLQEEFSNSEEAISLLKDETAKTQQLAHPSIVKVFILVGSWCSLILSIQAMWQLQGWKSLYFEAGKVSV